MAIYRFQVGHRGRLSSGASALLHVQYMLRLDGQNRQEELQASGQENMPAWAQDSPTAFWESAEKWERANGRVATTWDITLPRELSLEENVALLQDFLQTQFQGKHPVTWAIHDTRASDGGAQPHAHVAFSSRTLDGIDRGEALFFQRWNAKHPELGGAKKEPFFAESWAVEKQREAWAVVVNHVLEERGHEARVDARSLEERGIDREPEPKLPAYDTVQAKYKGRMTPGWEAIQRERTGRELEKELETRAAQRYWEEQKKSQGYAAEKTAFLQQVSRQMRERPQPVREEASIETIEREVAAKGKVLDRAHAAVMLAQGREERSQPPPERQAREMAAPQHDIDKSARLEKPLIGNRNSKIYHEAGQPNYGDVRPQNQVKFWTIADAEKAGYRRAKNDHHGPGADKAMEGYGQGQSSGQSQGQARGSVGFVLLGDDEMARRGAHFRTGRDREQDYGRGR